jgi:hypothetical protein
MTGTSILGGGGGGGSGGLSCELPGGMNCAEATPGANSAHARQMTINPHDEYVATVNADHKTATGNIPLRNRVQGF